MHPFTMKAQRVKISMAGPFTCLFNPRCMITTLEEEGCNTAAINHRKITITCYANNQKVPFPRYSTSNVFTDSSIALYWGNLDPELMSRMCISTSTQRLLQLSGPLSN